MKIQGVTVAVLVLLALSVGSAAAGEETTFGEGLSGTEVVAIGDVLATPDDYVGKTIRVEGEITDVCPRMGCWIEITAKEAGAVRFKVKDGVIVFPTEIKGKNVVAEGVFTRVDMTREDAISYAEHLAEEKGEPFDPASVKEPYHFYQIKGKGAVVR